MKAKKTRGVKAAASKPQAEKRRASKKLEKKKGAPAKAVAKAKGVGKKLVSGMKASKSIRKTPKKAGRGSEMAFSRDTTAPDSVGPGSGGQSGDLEGLSNVESVDSESVDELMEEGNAFEAGVVAGVEDSGEREGKEVRTREVPEDDVPGEYLDKD